MFQLVADARIEPARGAQHAHRFGDHVVGVAAVDMADGDHAAFDRLDGARDDGLECGDDVGGDHDRIDAEMRHRSVSALAGDGDLDVGDRGHDRAVAPGEGAGGHLRPVVHAEHHLHRAALEQAFLHHDLAAGQVLLRRLEDHVDGAVEVACLGQVFRRAEQHRGVAVMAAGVHHTVVLRGVGHAGSPPGSAARPCRRAGRSRG